MHNSNNKQVDDAYDIDVVMPMNILIDYGDIYLKTSGFLWQYYSDKPVLNNKLLLIFLLMTMIIFCLNLKKE